MPADVPTAERLRELRERAAKAAPGEWNEAPSVSHDIHRGGYRNSLVIFTDSRGRFDTVVDTLNAHHVFNEADRQAIGEYIAALHNQLPMLLDAADRAEAAERDRTDLLAYIDAAKRELPDRVGGEPLPDACRRLVAELARVRAERDGATAETLAWAVAEIKRSIPFSTDRGCLRDLADTIAAGPVAGGETTDA